MLHTGGGWGETHPPHMFVKRFGCTTIQNKALYKCIIHSFIHSLWWWWSTLGASENLLPTTGLGYNKFGNSLELSYSTVARVIQWFSKTGFTRNRPRKGRSKMLSPCAVRQVQKLASKNRRMSCCQHCFRGSRSGRSACQCSDHMPHTATSWFAWPSSQKEASSEAGSQKSLQIVC